MLKSNTGSSSDNTFYTLRLIEKSEGVAVNPYLKVLQKNQETGKYENTGNDITEIVGDLVSIALTSFTWEKQEIQKVRLIFADDGVKESYLLELNLSSSGRSVINCLASLESNKNISLQVYRNKRGRVTFAVKQDGQKVSWKYSMEEVPPAVEILHPKTGAVVSRDYEDVDNFFINELECIATKLGIKLGGKPATEKAPDDKPAVLETQAAKEQDAQEDDLF